MAEQWIVDLHLRIKLLKFETQQEPSSKNDEDWFCDYSRFDDKIVGLL